jgi:hypothetical protein
MKKKLQSLTEIKKDVWTIFSQYIRMKYADWRGYVRCVTCNAAMHWKKAQAGHFIPGRRNSILFDERHIYPQCLRCNVMLSGNLIKYWPFMMKKVGQEVIDELTKLNTTEKHWTREELYALKEKYRLKRDKLLQKVPQYYD